MMTLKSTAAGAAAIALIATGAALATPTSAAAAGPAPAGSDGFRGRLVSVTGVETLSDRAAVTAELNADGFDPGSARYGVRSYRLVYQTVDAHGRPTTASGLLAVPITGARQLPVVSYTHGTESYRDDAPSMQTTGFEPDPAYTFASAGFATVDPDYLGLGTGPGTQPWMDVPSETTAALDLLRAARGYLAGQGVSLDRKVMVTGFSQGASAALGLGRALQDGADPWFRLGALAPISGAYDFQNAEIPAILDDELVTLNPVPQLGAKYEVMYTALMLVAVNRVRPIAGMPDKIIQPAYAGTIEQLLDGNHTDDQVFNGTPDDLKDLLTPYGSSLLAHPTGGLLAELRTIDGVCTGWVPGAPTRLYLADDDEQAVNANTQHCQASFAAAGAAVPTVDLGTPDNQGSRHYGSNVAGTADIVTWFTQLTH